MSSLQDQLLKAGLIDSKKAKQAAKDKRKKDKVAKSQKDLPSEAEKQREQARAEKAARDRALNKERDAKVEEKAIAAQIVQLIEQHKQRKHHLGEEIEFHFSDGKFVKKMIVDANVERQLLRGQLAIARATKGFELVPKVVAEKIQQRDGSYIVVLNLDNQNTQADEDDPYKDYVIPDDLMW